MTDGEVERAIEFLLKSQANLEIKIGGLAGQVEGLIEQVGEINHIIRAQAESQSQLNELMTRAITELAEAQQRTVVRLDQTDARLDRLAAVVERLTEGRGGE
jgi:methyl-accepting chemotaxis protein